MGGASSRCGHLSTLNTCSSSKVSLQAAVTFLLKSLVTGELRRVLGVSRMPFYIVSTWPGQQQAVSTRPKAPASESTLVCFLATLTKAPIPPSPE